MVDAPLAGRSAGFGLSGLPAGDLALRVCGTEYDGRVVRLSAPKCTIGSGQSCTLRIHARGVSPVHCLIVRGAAGTAVRRWSRSTRLNGGVFIDSPLHVGDRLGVGPLEFEVVENPPGPSATPAHAAEPDATAGEAQPQEWEQRLAELQAELATARQALESERDERQAELDTLRADLNAKDVQLAELSAQLSERPSAAEGESLATPASDSSDEAQRQEWERRVAELQAELESARQAMEHERNELQARLDALRVDLTAKTSQLAELSARLAESPSAEDLERRAQAWEEKRRALHEKLEAAEEAARLAEERAAQWEQAAAQRYTPEGLVERETELRRREEELERQHEEAEKVLVQTRRRLEVLRHREEELHQRDRELRRREAEFKAERPAGAARDATPPSAEQPLAGEEAVSATMPLPLRGLNEQPGEDSASTPASSASEVLAKLGYTPDWSEEAETRAGALPADEAPIAGTSLAAPAPAPAPAESAPEAEDSIEDYMAMLMQRVGGGGRAAAGKPAAPRMTPRSAPAPSNKSTLAGVTVVLGSAEAPDGPKIKAEEFIPRSLAPERSDRLAAMREVANVSARSAIGRHTQTEWLTRAMGKGVFALLTAAMAVYLALAGRGTFSPTSGAAGAASIFAMLWSAQAALQFRRYLRGRRGAKAADGRQMAAGQVAAPDETPGQIPEETPPAAEA